MSEDEIRLIVAQLDRLMGALRLSVAALNAILATDPEVTGDNATA